MITAAQPLASYIPFRELGDTWTGVLVISLPAEKIPMAHLRLCKEVGVVVLLAACAQHPTVALTTGPVVATIASAQQDSQGYTVHVKLVNQGDNTVTLNPCLGPLQVQQGERWVTVGSAQPGGMCPMVAALVPGGVEADFVLAFLDLHVGDVVRYSPVKALVPEAIQSNFDWPESKEFVVR